MTATYQTLLADNYLRAVFDKEFQSFKDSDNEKALITRLEKWSKKQFQKETSSEAAFISVFFEETWGYSPSGKTHGGHGFSCYPQFPIAGAGAGGGVGEADAALGVFDTTGVPETPQVLCEFKDVRSNLDGPQKRKGNNRSPVKQCADYLREAMKPLYGNEAIQPTFGIVTDMNEFRLYWRNTMPSQFQRFIIRKATTDEGVALLGDEDSNSFQRYLFLKLFHAESLLTTAGAPALLRLIREQRFEEKKIEKSFYFEYRAYREQLVDLLIEHNPKFPGTKGRLVRLAQKLIDRCIFVMFCEDMGEQLSFPPNALRDYLSDLSKSPTFESDELDAWNKLKELFHAMNEGRRFRSHAINRFNGGLFATDAELDGLSIPNHAFCVKLQGENDDTLGADRKTLLYFAGSYNFGATGRGGRAVNLFTLGRIFEQSITELEALEAAKDKRESLTVVSGRKRDGVYYTPEWVVERVVAETISPRLDEIRAEVGWNLDLEGDEEAISKQIGKAPSERTAAFVKHEAGVRAFRDRLDALTVLDPACGSGAFLIHTLEFLLRERKRAQRELALVSGGKGEGLFEFKPDDEIRGILSRNIFGVDINPSSVEIARLALWLHTAKPDRPLSNLDSNIVTGNSLVGEEVYAFKKDLLSATEAKKETINAFDFHKIFHSVFNKERPGGAGFDCIVGNPPYVKLQNFKKVYSETADFLRNATGAGGKPRYASCQTGNYDLFLPFIERGLELLNKQGRLGYIAPSLWRYNEYGEGLRGLLHKGGHLDRWIDFGSYQVFDEAITYTALQFYSKEKHSRVRFALAPTGEVTRIPDWDDENWYVHYSELPEEDAWILVPRHERAVIAKLEKTCKRLSDKTITQNIFVGIQTSADHIYHLKRLGKGKYQYQPPKPKGARVKPAPQEVAIEDAIMHPIVSGREVHRFQFPKTDTYILFPYKASRHSVELFSRRDMKTDFPLAWAYLKKFEKVLRARETSAFNDEMWYRFGRNQNIDKQDVSKILVPRLCRDLAVVNDPKGQFFIDNVDVGGIEVADGVDREFLTGVLNSAVINFVWKRIAKPFQNGYLSANKQFIAPLPIPSVKRANADKIAASSRTLTKLHTDRRDTLLRLEKRYKACDVEEKPVEWLWPGQIRSLAKWKSKAPADLPARHKASWAKEQQAKEIELAVDALGSRLRPHTHLKAELIKGELRVLDDGVVVLDGVFVENDQGKQILIDWRNYFRLNPVPEVPDAESLARDLRSVRTTDSATIAKQVADLDAELSKVETEIVTQEAGLNKLACSAYALTPAELKIVFQQP